MKIKLTLIFAFIAAFCAGTLIAGALVFDFAAKSDGDNIRVEWRTTEETNLLYFAIERRPGNSNDFHEIAQVRPQGNNSYYSYIDQSAYKATDSFYAYRLAIYAQNEPVHYVEGASTIHYGVSGVKRTWGSIKAMFR